MAWKTTTSSFPNGESVFINPAGSNESYVPGLRIDTYKSLTPKEIAQKQGVFRAIGLSESLVTVQNGQYTQFKGTFTTPQGIDQEGHVFIDNPTPIIVNYYYLGSKSDSKSEALFKRILGSFTVR